MKLIQLHTHTQKKTYPNKPLSETTFFTNCFDLLIEWKKSVLLARKLTGQTSFSNVLHKNRPK